MIDIYDSERYSARVNSPRTCSAVNKEFAKSSVWSLEINMKWKSQTSSTNNEAAQSCKKEISKVTATIGYRAVPKYIYLVYKYPPNTAQHILRTALPQDWLLPASNQHLISHLLSLDKPDCTLLSAFTWSWVNHWIEHQHLWHLPSYLHEQNAFVLLQVSRSVWEYVECKLRSINFRRVSDLGRALWPAFGVTGMCDDWYRSTMGVIVISLGTHWSDGESFECTWECHWTYAGTTNQRWEVPGFIWILIRRTTS